jgi:O-antigen ligase
MVIEHSYAGGLPGLSIRYYGLAPHANTIAPLAIAFMLCLWRYPFQSNRINVSSWVLAIASLVLAQSKTSIAIGFVLVLFLVIYRYRSRQPQDKSGNSMEFTLGIIALLCFTISALIFAFYFGAGDKLLEKLNATSGGQLSTLSGRTQIWAVAWREFLAHPFFGFGPSVWGAEYRMQIGMNFAFHAHNQLMQSLSSAGIIGGIGLIVYVVTFIVYAIRATKSTHGLSLALVVLMLFRCFDEVPFAIASPMQPEFFMQLLALIACIGFAPSANSITSSTSMQFSQTNKLVHKGS